MIVEMSEARLGELRALTRQGGPVELVSGLIELIREVERLSASAPTAAAAPIPMTLWCPLCGERHVDVGEYATKEHHTHACQGCGLTWRPAVVPTVGVQFLPGYKNEEGGTGAIMELAGQLLQQVRAVADEIDVRLGAIETRITRLEAGGS